MRKLSVRFIAIVMSLICLIGPVAADPLKAQASSMSDRKKYALVFDSEYYYNNYADVAAAYGNDYDKLLDHYIAFGVKEGRNASAQFNAKAYRENNADLDAAYGDDWASYHQHYAVYGKAEGRKALAGNNKNSSTAKKTTTAAKAATAGTVIGSYTTYYEANEARAVNVGLAASKINGVVIQPGATFSYNGTVGARTTAAGYVVAPIYVSGKVSSGVGGGICQVSSTLYAATIGTSLNITERHAHSLPVHYIPTGMDATVSWGAQDLKFVNTYKRPLQITASANKGALTVTLTLK